jgi:hypothetical protein
MADLDTTGTDESPADASDSIAYSPEWTERTFADVDFTSVDVKQHGEAAVAVDLKGDSAVSLEIRQNPFVTAFSVMDADTAEWLADQLRDHAEAARQAD